VTLSACEVVRARVSDLVSIERLPFRMIREKGSGLPGVSPDSSSPCRLVSWVQVSGSALVLSE
jgi:hypothetical protein